MAIIRPLAEVAVADAATDHTIDWDAIDVPGSEEVFILFHGDHTVALRLENADGLGLPIPVTSGEPFQSGPYKPDHPKGFSVVSRAAGSTAFTYTVLLSEPFPR